MRTSRWFFSMMLCVAALAGGCATPAVWEVKTCHPAINSNLSLAFDPKSNDFLVKYDEQRASSQSIQTRCYWLLANANNRPKDQPPHFVDEVKTPDLISVPVLDYVITNSVPETGYGAKLFASERSFDLYHDRVLVGEFSLPNYPSPDQMKTVFRVMLTPPAVIADAMITVGTVATISSPYYIEGYGHSH